MFQRDGVQRKKIAASTMGHDYNDEITQLTGRFSTLHIQIGEAATARPVT